MTIRKPLSVQQKITGIIFLICALVLLLTSVQFGFVVLQRLNDEARNDAMSLARLVSANSRFPLAIRDYRALDSLLDSLEARAEVVSAHVLLPSGQSAASYSRSRSSHARLTTEEQMSILNLEAGQIEEGLKHDGEITWNEGRLNSLFMPINFEGTRAGYLYLNYEHRSLRREQLSLLLGWLLSIGVAGAVTYLLSARLQRHISLPIQQLAAQMEEISREKRLHGFEPKNTQDEFGLLFQGFDEMMNALMERDRMLEKHRRNLESEVQERTRDLSIAKEKAEQATLAKSRFLANMSHEIRTPMIGVLGMADLLRQKPLNEEDRQMAATIYRSGEALLTILNDVLDVSKIEAGRLEFEIQPFSLSRLVAEVVDLMRVTAQVKGVGLELEMAGDLPDVLGDEGRVRQILLNLVGNAIKFTEKGKVSVALSGVQRESDALCECQIVIRDTGIGIAPESRGRIFDAFGQADSGTTRKHGGSGLGLSIVRELVHMMDGSIDLDSTLGVGSVFTVRLPLSVARQDSLPSRQPITATQTQALVSPWPSIGQGPDSSRRRRILLVEDNATTQELLTLLLRQMNFELLIANDGREAVDILAAQHVDLVLMDCQMPLMDGFKATGILRTSGLTVPIIALTAHAREEDARRCFEAGMDDFLCKPFRQADLRAVLAKWLASDTPAAGNVSAGGPG